MPASFSVEYEGRTVEVIPDPIWEQDRVRLVVDGETVAETKANAKQTVLASDGFEVRAAHQAAWGRRHPKLYASRYVVSGAAQVAMAIIGFTFLLRLIPAIPWPSIDLPDLPRINLPDLPLPSFQIDLELPGWVQAVLDSKPYWVPIVVGLVLASRELKRRKKLRRDG